MRSLPIVYTSISVRFLPRQGWVQVHVPTRKFIEAKSGYCIGTAVGAADTVVCAVEATGAVESTAKSAHPSAVKTEGFMPLCPFFQNAPTKRVPKFVLFKVKSAGGRSLPTTGRC